MENHPIVHKIKSLIKPVNYALGFAVGVVGICVLLEYLDLGIPLYYLVYPSYMIFFGVIMLASDFKLHVIIQNCKFMEMCFGRGLFYLYVGSLQWYMKGADGITSGSFIPLIATIAAIIFWGLGGILIILHFISSERKLSNDESEAKDTSIVTA